MNPSKEYPVVCWWSGGVTSAVACKIAIDIFGKDNCVVIMIDTFMNEHPDTYRFLMDCEEWYGKKIEMVRNERYKSIQDVWYTRKSLNVAHGAICSSELKRKVRIDWCKENTFSHHVFGFEFDKKEMNRALSMQINYSDINPIFPLLMYGMDKPDCIDYIQEAGLDIPKTYELGYENNNCWQTGCVQGGIGYWQKIQREEPEKFDAMAKIEHDLTNIKGEPVTINKDQSQEAKEKPMKESLVFLLPHPDYPNNKSLSDMDGREPEPLTECNGYCGLDDLNENEAIIQGQFEF